MRITGLLCLIVAIATLLRLNGQAFTNSLVAIALTTIASGLFFFASRSNRMIDSESIATKSRPLPWIAILALTLAAGLAVRLPAAYEKQDEFNKGLDFLMHREGDEPAVDVSQLRYAHPKLRSLVKIVDREVRRRSGEGWHHATYRPKLAKGDALIVGYEALWSERPLKDARRSRFPKSNTFYRLLLRTLPSPDKTPVVVEIALNACRFPEDGWGTNIKVTCEARSSSSPIDVDINAGLIEFRKRDVLSRIGVSSYVIQGTKNFGDRCFGYSFYNANGLGLDDLRTFVSDAATFHDATLALRDQWEEEIRVKLSSEPLIGIPLKWDARRDAPPRSLRDQATEEQMAEILDAALSPLEEQRMLIQKNYVEMHAALVSAFPLVESLDEARIQSANVE